MVIVSVIPLQRGIPFDTLSYYSNEALSVGTLVEIPIGRQFIKGLVVESTALIEAKMNIKSASFSLKKVKTVLGSYHYSAQLVEGLLDARKKTTTPIGALASSILNDSYVDSITRVLETPFEESHFSQELPHIVYGDKKKRTDEYKRIIRSAFADKQSVLFVAPSIRSLEYWFSELKKGIGEYARILHSKKTKKDIRATLSLLKEGKRPFLICATPQYAFPPEKTPRVCILEEEASDLYRQRDRYKTDMRTVIESIYKSMNGHLVYGETLPRFETLVAYNKEVLPRSFFPERLVITSLEKERSFIPYECIELIRYAHAKKKSVYIYTNRKGFAPLSRCADCYTVVECPTCALPIVLKTISRAGELVRQYLCSHCGDTLPSTHTCVHCGSWNITTTPVGTESLYEEVVREVGSERVYSIDDDSTPDEKTVEQLIEEIGKHPYSIVVGTQKIIPYLKKPFDFVIIPFFDRIISVPSPYTIEQTLRLLFLSNEYAKDSVIVCTRHPEFPTTEFLLKRNITDIVLTDIEDRKLLGYPPFGTVLKISITASLVSYEGVNEKIKAFFDEYHVSAHPPRKIEKGNPKLLCVWIASVPIGYLEDTSDTLRIFLDSLRLPYTIDTHPERL